MMNIVLMGCPGAGKGTQSAKLQDAFHLKHISTGDVLRAEIASGSDLGKQIAQIINRGKPGAGCADDFHVGKNCKRNGCRHYL